NCQHEKSISRHPTITRVAFVAKKLIRFIGQEQRDALVASLRELPLPTEPGRCEGLVLPIANEQKVIGHTPTRPQASMMPPAQSTPRTVAPANAHGSRYKGLMEELDRATNRVRMLN